MATEKVDAGQAGAGEFAPMGARRLLVLGGIGLILPWLTGVLPWLTPLAAAGLAVDMLLASGFHLTRREYRAMGGTIVLLVLAALVAYGRFALAA